MSSGKLELQPVELDLARLVTDIVDGFRASAQRAGSPIGLDTPAAVPGRWDRLRLEQVVSNLLSNAIKYGAGSPIDVRVRDRGDRVEIEVSDAGIGIALDAQTRIFGRFERGASERNYAGLGLGLWIVRELAEAHGGTAAVRSAGSGLGATFVVTLPRR
jgi:signal transduction histidine kinase